jgi:hypothetical protein
VQNPTLLDVHLGEIYYKLLIDLARNAPGSTIRYGDLIDLARARYDTDEAVGKSIPISIGRRLEMVVKFCGDNGLPDLACLAVGVDDEPGGSYPRRGQTWLDERMKVAAFDLSLVHLQWKSHTQVWRRAATKLVRRTPEEADLLLRSHWKENASGPSPHYPRTMENRPKSRLLALLMDGRDAGAALRHIFYTTGQ